MKKKVVIFLVICLVIMVKNHIKSSYDSDEPTYALINVESIKSHAEKVKSVGSTFYLLALTSKSPLNNYEFMPKIAYVKLYNPKYKDTLIKVPLDNDYKQDDFIVVDKSTQFFRIDEQKKVIPMSNNFTTYHTDFLNRIKAYKQSNVSMQIIDKHQNTSVSTPYVLDVEYGNVKDYIICDKETYDKAKPGSKIKVDNNTKFYDSTQASINAIEKANSNADN